MTSVSACLQALRAQSQCALIPFITAGDPDLETTAIALQTLDRAGADVIELGLPYADPLADGPTIQAAATRALRRGTRFEAVLEMVQATAGSLQAPLILFAYFNPIFHRGIEPFLERVAAAGIKGMVIPDLPLEEAAIVLEPAAERGIEVTLLIAPNSPPERIAAIAQKSQGFIYLVSVTGVTGARAAVASRVKDLLPQLRAVTDKPIGVGFGISQPEHARQVKLWGADAAIVGSAIVQRLASGSPGDSLRAVEQFCGELKAALQAT